MKDEIPVTGCVYQDDTCWFRMDAVTSALNAGSRAQLDNLYIGDTSVFPSIGAKNQGSLRWPTHSASAITCRLA